MRPEHTRDYSGLDQTEAEQDGTALIGHADPEQTDRFEVPRGRNPVSAASIGQDWNRISERIAELFLAGVADNDPRTREAVHEHYRWIGNFWSPDRDSYIRLARMYVSQPKFRKRIERKKPEGMAAYLRDAMIAYAYSQLQ